MSEQKTTRSGRVFKGDTLPAIESEDENDDVELEREQKKKASAQKASATGRYKKNYGKGRVEPL